MRPPLPGMLLTMMLANCVRVVELALDVDGVLEALVLAAAGGVPTWPAVTDWLCDWMTLITS